MLTWDLFQHREIILATSGNFGKLFQNVALEFLFQEFLSGQMA